MPITFTAEREAELRASMLADYDYGPEEQKSGEGQELLAELDAERAAHQETQAKLDAWLALGAETPHGLSVVMDAACAMAKLREQKLTETQTRLAATLAHFDNAFGLQMQSMLAVIERDFTMKQEVRSLKTQFAETQAIARELLEALEPFARAWDDFEWEPLDGKPNAKERINGELDCSLDIQIKYWRTALAVSTKAKGVLPAAPEVQFYPIHPPSRRQD